MKKEPSVSRRTSAWLAVYCLPSLLSWGRNARAAGSCLQPQPTRLRRRLSLSDPGLHCWIRGLALRILNTFKSWVVLFQIVKSWGNSAPAFPSLARSITSPSMVPVSATSALLGNLLIRNSALRPSNLCFNNPSRSF